MAEDKDSGQEKTEKATEKRKKEAREEGQVPRSRELNTMLGLLAAAGALAMFKGFMGRHLEAAMRNGLSHARGELFDPHALISCLHANFINILVLLAPLFAVALAAALLAPQLLGGWNFSVKALAFKPEKLNPVKGLGKLFGPKSAVEVAKALAKFLLIGYVAFRIVMYFKPQFLKLGIEPLHVAVAHGTHLVIVAFFLLGGALVAIAAVDVPFQLWNHERELKMTRQQVKDESKETEGQPEVKGRLRQLQQQAAQRRMMDEVPKADVVVTNPTHYAVALRYDEVTMHAPRVVAKGADEMAARIRALATHHQVPLVAAPPLARALHASTAIGREVPAGLYVAVAQVLTYIYQLRAALDAGETPPDAPNPAVDPEFHA
jgi:flagellar biosynthetic protein FlhB